MQDVRGFYKKILKNSKDGFVLLKSADEFYGCHYKGSALNVLTGFTGSAAEALIDYNGNITLFVDPRYHEQADFETKGKNVEVVKLNQGEGFVKGIAKKAANSELFVCNCISLSFYKKLQNEGLKLRVYEDFKGVFENKNINFRKKIFKVNARENKADLIKKHIKTRYYLVNSLEQICWLCNLRSFQMVENSTFKAKLLLDFKGKHFLFCDQKLESIPSGYQVLPLKDFNKKICSIKDKIAFLENTLTLGDFSLIKNPFVLKKDYIAKYAAIKEKCEIEHYKSAFFRLDCALKSFKNKIKAGLSEFELKEIFEKELIRYGAKATSFKTILAIGDNSSSIHYSNYDKNKILKEGDLILLDCGGYYEMGLATDITRVFLCAEKATKKQKEIYSVVLKAFLNAYHSKEKDGAGLDKLARKILKPYEKQGFYFPHALGHGIGIPIHQLPPVIASIGEKKFPLYKNMTHTIEPGLYCSKGPHKFGIRLENSVFVTGPGKRESFSHFEFEEKLIDYNMLTKKEQKWLKEWNKTWEVLSEKCGKK